MSLPTGDFSPHWGLTHCQCQRSGPAAPRLGGLGSPWRPGLTRPLPSVPSPEVLTPRKKPGPWFPEASFWAQKSLLGSLTHPLLKWVGPSELTAPKALCLGFGSSPSRETRSGMVERSPEARGGAGRVRRSRRRAFEGSWSPYGTVVSGPDLSPNATPHHLCASISSVVKWGLW